MRIEKTHNLNSDEVIERIDQLINNLTQQQITGDITVSNISKVWQEEFMDFSFRVSKGFFGANIQGKISVTDSNIVLDVIIPPIISAFINEQQMKDSVGQKMGEVFSNI